MKYALLVVADSCWSLVWSRPPAVTARTRQALPAYDRWRPDRR